MNGESGGPFFHRIKPLGKKTDDYKGMLTQATFVKRLQPLVANNPDKVRDDIKRKVPLKADDPINRDCIFWKLFVEEKDWANSERFSTTIFIAVRAKFEQEWNSETSPLPRTIGFSALMRLLPSLYREGQERGTLEEAFFSEKLGKAKPLAPFSFDEYPASGVGENKLYQALVEKISLNDSAPAVPPAAPA